jgi:hypothetical protein
MGQIVHVVLLQWAAPEDGSAERADALVEQNLAPLPGIVSLDHGPSVSGEGLEDGFDWALVIRFESEQALADYLPLPEEPADDLMVGVRQVVGGFLGEHSRRLVVFDLAAG